MKTIFIGAIEVENTPCLLLTGNRRVANKWGHWSMSAMQQVGRRLAGLRFRRNVNIGDAGMITATNGFTLEEAEAWLRGFWKSHRKEHEENAIMVLRDHWPIKRTTTVAC